MDVVYIFKLLRKHLWLLITVPAIAGIAAFFFTMNMQRSYKSETTIATNFTTDQNISFDGARSSYFETTVNFVNAIETMSSPMVMDLVSFQLLAHDLKSGRTAFRFLEHSTSQRMDTAALLKLLDDKLNNFKYLNPQLHDEKAILELIKALKYDTKSLAKNLTISRVNNSDFIKVQFLAEDPSLAAFVVNSVSDQFIRFHNNVKTSNSSESLNFFTTVLKEKEAALQQRVDRLNEFKLQNNVVDLTTESQSKIALITQYEQTKNTTIEELRNIRIELQYINTNINRGAEVASQSELIGARNKKILELKSELNRLSSQYIDGGSSDSQLSEKIDRINRELAIETSSLEDLTAAGRGPSNEEFLKRKVELELKEQMATQKLLQAENNISSLRSSVSSAVGKDAEFANLQADVNVAAQEYKMVQEKFNSARNASLVTESGLKQIVPGQPADAPEPSKKIMLILLSVAASFALCLIYVFAAEFIDSSIRVPSRLEKVTKIRNVGMVNALNTDINNLAQMLVSTFRQEKIGTDLNTFKQLLGKLRFEAESSRSKVILVTSAREQVGKSYLIVGLAYSLSLINKKVLIIDTNFKNNSLTKLLIKHRNIKLLKQDNSAEDSTDKARRAVISPTFHNNINIIGNDGGNVSPLEIFKGGDFARFLDTVGAQYDYVLLEGAALNTFSDSYELCQYVDKVIAVFSASSELNEADKDSLDALRSLREKLIGTVLNRVEMSNLSA